MIDQVFTSYFFHPSVEEGAEARHFAEADSDQESEGEDPPASQVVEQELEFRDELFAASAGFRRRMSCFHIAYSKRPMCNLHACFATAPLTYKLVIEPVPSSLLICIVKIQFHCFSMPDELGLLFPHCILQNQRAICMRVLQWRPELHKSQRRGWQTP